MIGRDKDDYPSAESRVELENALIALVLQHGARIVMETAQDLYAQTKEGKQEAAALASEASEDRWERQRQASAGARTGGASRKNSAFEEAKRLLGG